MSGGYITMKTYQQVRETAETPNGRRRRGPRGFETTLFLSSILLLCLAAHGHSLGAMQDAEESRPPVSETAAVDPAVALEREHGVRVALIAVTAAGGMIDFRFKVVDAEKADRLLRQPGGAPTLFIEKAGVTLAASHWHPPDKFEFGKVYYILYPNSRNAVKPGSEVIVQLGDLRLLPIKAQ